MEETQFIGLVLCRRADGAEVVRTVEAFPTIKKGDVVIDEYKNELSVISNIDVPRGSEEHNFIVEAFGEKNIYKLKYKLQYIEI